MFAKSGLSVMPRVDTFKFVPALARSLDLIPRFSLLSMWTVTAVLGTWVPPPEWDV